VVIEDDMTMNDATPSAADYNAHAARCPSVIPRAYDAHEPAAPTPALAPVPASRRSLGALSLLLLATAVLAGRLALDADDPADAVPPPVAVVTPARTPVAAPAPTVDRAASATVTPAAEAPRAVERPRRVHHSRPMLATSRPASAYTLIVLP